MIRYLCKKGEYIDNVPDRHKSDTVSYHEELQQRVEKGVLNEGLDFLLKNMQNRH